tara:strand:+ start:865 stop:1464 length:600 start_codon:yes stop_codon:yes gene_type:complete
MWALVESGSVTKVYTRPRALTIGDVSYPQNIFTMWSSSDLEALGIYAVEFNSTNFKDQAYYINTNQTFAFGSGKVTASYGSATAIAIADTLYTAEEEAADATKVEGTVKTKGLKTTHKETINSQAGSLLSETDWYSIRAADGGTAVPSSVATHRAAVRTKANAMQVQIDGAANVDALAALYVYNDATPPVRPLGEFPTL